MAFKDALCNNWFQIITDNKNLEITRQPGFTLDTVEPIEVNGETETSTIDGVDGSIPMGTSFKPFDLKFNFIYYAVDQQDFFLFMQKLNNLMNMRKPYYIRHSKMEGLKYAVLPSPNISYKKMAGNYYEIEMTFTCYKGYAETADYPMNSQKFHAIYEHVYNIFNPMWQFEENMTTERYPVYRHKAKRFKIFNGSTDVIDPSLHHELNIKINVKAPNGFKMTNHTTGDVFKYTKAIEKKETFQLVGLLPFVDDLQVGDRTNHNWITLAKGDNDIQIEGIDMEIPESDWKFPFIFR